MSACESGWWASVTDPNNYFGTTLPPAFPGDSQSAWCKTTEYTTPTSRLDFATTRKRRPSSLIRKRVNSMYRWFVVYPLLEAAVEAYVDLLIESMRYFPARVSYQKDGDADKFMQAVCAAGYATGPAFKVELEIEHQQNTLYAVDMARSEGNQ
jgi:hypothetical protein